MEECYLESPILVINDLCEKEKLEFITSELFKINFKNISLLILKPNLDDIFSVFVKNGLTINLCTKGKELKKIVLFISNNEEAKKIINHIEFEIKISALQTEFQEILEAIAYCHLFGIPIYLNIYLETDDIELLKQTLFSFIPLGIYKIKIICPLPEKENLHNIPSPQKIKDVIVPKIEILSRLSDYKILWTGWNTKKNSPLYPCEAFYRLSIAQNGDFLFCPILEMYFPHKREIRFANIFHVSIRDAISMHYKMLAEVLRWRMKAKSLINFGKYPLCYWCLYQFGMLNWISDFPDSLWAEGIREAKQYGLYPMF